MEKKMKHLTMWDGTFTVRNRYLFLQEMINIDKIADEDKYALNFLLTNAKHQNPSGRIWYDRKELNNIQDILHRKLESKIKEKK